MSNYIMTSLTASGLKTMLSVLKSAMNSLIVYLTLSDEEECPGASEEGLTFMPSLLGVGALMAWN